MNNNYQSPRIGFLDGFRFLLAFWVFAAHYYTLIGGTMFFKLPSILIETFNKPVNAVNGFMVITGFLMTYNYIERRSKEPYSDQNTHIKFWQRRFFRLYPIYILCIIAAFITFVPLAKMNEANLIFFTGSNVSQWGTVRSMVQPSVPDLISHIFMVHGLFPRYYDSVLGVTWSLSLEAQFYLLFPFLFLGMFSSGRKQRQRIVVGIIAFVVVAIVSIRAVNFGCSAMGLPTYTLPAALLFTMPLFIIGVIAAAVKLRQIHLTYLLVAASVTLPFQSNTTVVLVLALLLLIFLDEIQFAIPKWLFRILDSIRGVLSTKTASFGADISYSFYLIHTMIIGIVLQILITFLPELSRMQIAILGFFAVAIVCIFLSYFLFKFVEKPFIELGRRMIHTVSRAQIPLTKSQSNQ